MGSKLTNTERKLYKAVDEVIHYIWDPIGVSDVPEARDEYYSYLPQVFSMLQADQSAKEIASHLKWIATDRMGLAEQPEHDLAAANLLLQWKEAVASSVMR